MIIILMGVSGAGKTTIGRLLAQELGWPFYEGDDFHPQANVDKMRRGIPLTDADRDPWLAALERQIRALVRAGRSAVIACSALKQAYRDRLKATSDVRFVYLKGDYRLIRERLEKRRGHYMAASLLASQFETLEEPEGAPVINVTLPPHIIVNQIRRELQLDEQRNVKASEGAFTQP